MTSPDPMTRDELLELAPLDAFGLLDDYEAAMFNRSFHHAPVAVQAEIMHIQAELAEASTLLSGDEPRPLLRQKVLVRLQDEIEEANEQLQPLAQIGNPGLTPIHPAIGPHVAGQTGAAGAVGASTVRSMLAAAGTLDASSLAALNGGGQHDEAMRELVAEIRARAAAGVKDRATPYWRAAAFFLAAGLLVSLYFLARTMRTAEMVAAFAQNQVLNHQLASLVPGLADFAYRDSQIRGLASVDSTVNAAASFIIDAKNNRACLVAFGLSASKGQFTLRAVDDRGNARVITSFQATDPVFGLVASDLPTDVNLLTAKLELLDGDGRVILRTA